jgi:DNA polymerase III subunit delta
MAKEKGADFDEMISAIRSKKFSPVYFFCGEEEFFIDQLVDAIENSVLTETEKAFNQSVIYGKDATAQNVIETCRRLPMMSDKQLVIIKEAQSFKEIDGIINYLKNPVKSTILAIAYKHGLPDKRKAFGKEIQKQSVYFESNPLRDYQMPAWIKKYIKEKGYKIDDIAVDLLAEYTGTDLSTVSNEISKLIINKPKGSSITTTDIESGVGVSKEYNSFELSNALANKNVTKAHKIINYFSANPKNGPIPLVLGTLQGFFAKAWVCYHNKQKSDYDLAALLKVNPYFVKDYKAACAKYSVQKMEYIFYVLEEYDLRSKGIGNNSIKEGELLKEVIIKILE